MKTYKWSLKTCWKVLELYEGQRHSLRDITNVTHVLKSTIGDIKKHDTGVSKPWTGRLKKLSQQDISHIVGYICTNRATCRLTLGQLIQNLNLEIHENTLHKALEEAGYKRRVARHCSFLSIRDRAWRLKYAEEYLHWTVEDWSQVLFSDEMSIKLFMKWTGKDWIWRNTGEEYYADCINYERCPQRIGTFFWGAFRKGKIGPGVFFDLKEGQTVNSVVYRDQILLGPLKEF